MEKKLKKEKPMDLFLEETKCKYETLHKVGYRIWKQCNKRVVFAIVSSQGTAILWHSNSILLKDWWETNFSLSMMLIILDSGEKGNLTNIYGPSVVSQINSFLEFLRWMKGKVWNFSWIMGRDLNPITSMG